MSVTGEGGDMWRAILLGIAIITLILFVAWIFRDPIYVMLQQCDETQQHDRADMAGLCVISEWINADK